MKSDQAVHVAVAVVKNKKGEILISQRRPDVHQGGLWEFPGGKVEVGETGLLALRRELKEELNIHIKAAEPLINIKHTYIDLQVYLEVFIVNEFSGSLRGVEGQPIRWVAVNQLKKYAFPEANLPIITALKLPRCYAILPAGEVLDLCEKLMAVLKRDIKLIQFRDKAYNAKEVDAFLAFAVPLCKKFGALLMINSAIKSAFSRQVDGLHLTSSDLMTLQQKPTCFRWVSASCHNEQELQQAEKLNLDFAVLAPVCATKTHPGAVTLGWKQVTDLLLETRLPVYVLGGLKQTDMFKAIQSGAQGLAGIRMFLE